MKNLFELLIHSMCTLFVMLKPGGVKAVMAENLAMKQQLIVMNRGRKRAPPLTVFDRFYFGLIGFFVQKNRICKIAVIVKPATIIKFHKALVQRKYRMLYSPKIKTSGRKGPDKALIDLVIEIHKRNPMIGYGRIAMQLFDGFGIEISRFAVGRILRKHYKKSPDTTGPSWLTFIGNMKDSLWSVDLFQCDSINLKTHWVMIVIDQYTRRIVGFSVKVGPCDGIAYCRMFNEIIAGKALPQYLSTDNDPLFEFRRWKTNLNVLDIEQIKTIPYTPISHPFVERTIGTVRRECLDHMLFFNERDLQAKLDEFRAYYNQVRIHSSLNMKAPNNVDDKIEKEVVSLNDYQWKSYCRGLYRYPVAA